MFVNEWFGYGVCTVGLAGPGETTVPYSFRFPYTDLSISRTLARADVQMYVHIYCENAMVLWSEREYGVFI